MPGPYKNLSNPRVNANAYAQTKTVPVVPGKDQPHVNEERSDTVPDHPPEIPWPQPALGVDHKPTK